MTDKQMIEKMRKDVRGWNNPDSRLKFSEGNAKLDGIWNISLPAGHSCPYAKQCQSRTTIVPKNESGFGVVDGPNCEWRCFAATDESKYPATRHQRWFNYLSLIENKSAAKMADLIQDSLPKSRWGAPIRIHVSGDFFSQMYFDAWLIVANRNPNQVFYAYTKALPLWVKRIAIIPKNFKLTASYGGTHDRLISEHNLRSAKVVFTVEEAASLGLEIDHDDGHAYGDGPSFALLLHGTQPAGTKAAKAWSALKKQGIGGYAKQKDGREKISNVGVPTPR